MSVKSGKNNISNNVSGGDDENYKSIIDKNINVYEELKNVSITNEAEFKRYFIMSYYQTIPKYYLFCNNQHINSIIYNFSVGSGKTAAALFVVQENIDLYKKYIFNQQFMPEQLNKNIKYKINKNVIVIGSWVSVNAVINELMKEEFGLVTHKEIELYNKYMNSNIVEDRKYGEALKHKIRKRIETYIEFYGYQKFVNACFPNLSNASISQDSKILIENYKNGSLNVDPKFKERLKGSIIIIDECQKLYSVSGMNSFGFTVMTVSKLAQELNIKMVFLSGTIFNTSLSELVSIVNIMCEHKDENYKRYKTVKGVFDESDCLESKELIDGYNTLVPTKDFLKVAEELLTPHFIYYNHSKINKDVKYEGKLMNIFDNIISKNINKKSSAKNGVKGAGNNNTNNTYHVNNTRNNNIIEYYRNKYNIKKSDNVKNNNIKDTTVKNVRDNVKGGDINKNSDEFKKLVFPKRQNLSIEQHIGNIEIRDKNNKIKMLLYSCETYGLQKEQYGEFLKTNKQENIDLEEEESEKTLFIHDVALPPTKEYIKNGIIQSNNGFIGKFLKAETLKNYSTIGYNLIQICKEKCTHGEKCIVYHNKLNNFGIFQYMLILGNNGFVKYGDSTKNESICKECGRTYEEHNLSIEERISIRCCNKFKPIYYYYLIGNMNQYERETIVGNVYNNPKNLYGDLLSIMFVSDVAYSGVSFLNTNNIILLSKISNISKWIQICARIIRTKSHAMLPPERQYANVYTMIINYPNEQKQFKTKYTYEEKYYLIRTLLNDNVEEYIDEFNPKTIGYKLFNEPEKIKFDENEKKMLLSTYVNDINKDIQKIIKKYVTKFPNKIWKLETFINRLKNNLESYTYLNLSKIDKKYIISVLSTSKYTNIFTYNSDNTNTLYISFENKNNNKEIELTTFNYRDIQAIPRDNSMIAVLIDKMVNNPYIAQKRMLMKKILKFVGQNYALLTSQQQWWETIFLTHNEYYENDEKEFIQNHYSKNRNLAKVAGFYNGENIILKDGTIKRINITFPNYMGWKDIPYKFRISCLGSFSLSAPFYLHVNIIKKSGTAEDSRKIPKGITCMSFDINELHKYLGIDRKKFDNKTDLCLTVLQTLIDKQYKNMNDRNLYTPFEK